MNNPRHLAELYAGRIVSFINRITYLPENSPVVKTGRSQLNPPFGTSFSDRIASR